MACRCGRRRRWRALFDVPFRRSLERNKLRSQAATGPCGSTRRRSKRPTILITRLAKFERAVPGGVGAEGPCHPAPSPFHLRGLAVSLFVSFGEFEQHDFLALVVDIVQYPVRADSQPILSGELCHDEFSYQLLRALALRSGIGFERSDGGNDSGSVVVGNLFQCLLKEAFDPLAWEDDSVFQLNAHFSEEPLRRDCFPLPVLDPCPFDFPEKFLVL